MLSFLSLLTAVPSVLASFMCVSVQEADRSLAEAFYFLFFFFSFFCEPHWNQWEWSSNPFKKRWLFVCPERAFPQGAAAQEALTAMVAIEPPWAVCVFLLVASHSCKEWGCWWDPCLLPPFFICVFDKHLCALQVLWHQPGMVGRSLWPGTMCQWHGHVVRSSLLMMALSNLDIFCWLGLLASKLSIKGDAYFRNEVICHLDLTISQTTYFAAFLIL